MLYFKDPVQIEQIAKDANAMLIDLDIEKYQKELNYWTEQYPIQLQVWEDDGGFITKEFFIYE